MSGHPAVFLDRDGVIIENRSDYVKAWEEVQFLPGALKGLRRLAESPYALVLVTNQSAVGRGIISLHDAITINQRLIAEIESHGGRLDRAYLCPHRVDDGCGCRKPPPGMLMEASKDIDLDLPSSYVVGDAQTDLEAAAAVGACAILVLSGRGRAQLGRIVREAMTFTVVADLEAAADHILGGRR